MTQPSNPICLFGDVARFWGDPWAPGPGIVVNGIDTCCATKVTASWKTLYGYDPMITQHLLSNGRYCRAGTIWNLWAERIDRDRSSNLYLANGQIAAKHHPGGAQAWTFDAGAQINGIAVDKTGCLWLATSPSSAHQDSGEDSTIMRLNADGTLQWARHPGFHEDYFARDICIDDDCNAYALGYWDRPDYEPYDPSHICKYDSVGDRQWMSGYGGGPVVFPDDNTTIAIDADRNVYVPGSLFLGVSPWRAWGLLKYSGETGGLIWSNADAPTSSMVLNRSLCVTPTGYIVVAGRVWMQKYTTAGEFVSERKVPWVDGAMAGRVAKLASDDDGDVYALVPDSSNSPIFGGVCKMTSGGGLVWEHPEFGVGNVGDMVVGALEAREW